MAIEFPVADARVWNELQRNVNAYTAPASLCSRLKTHLFSRSFPWLSVVPAKWYFDHLCYLLTYILTYHKVSSTWSGIRRDNGYIHSISSSELYHITPHHILWNLASISGTTSLQISWKLHKVWILVCTVCFETKLGFLHLLSNTFWGRSKAFSFHNSRPLINDLLTYHITNVVKVTTFQTEKSRTFLDTIAGNMSNKCAFITPNSPWTSRMKNKLHTNKVQVSYMMIWERVHAHHSSCTVHTTVHAQFTPQFSNCILLSSHNHITPTTRIPWTIPDLWLF